MKNGDINDPPCLGDTPIAGVMHADLIGDIGQPPCKGYIDQSGFIGEIEQPPFI